MPLVPVLKGPAPSAALTSFPSSSFRDSPRCTFSRPFARPNSFFFVSPYPPAGPLRFHFVLRNLGPPRRGCFRRRPRPAHEHSPAPSSFVPAGRCAYPPTRAAPVPTCLPSARPSGRDALLPRASRCACRRPRCACRAGVRAPPAALVTCGIPRPAVGKLTPHSLLPGSTRQFCASLARCLFSVNRRMRPSGARQHDKALEQCHRRKHDHLVRCDFANNETRNSGRFRRGCDKR